MSQLQPLQMLYEGKAKQIFATNQPHLLWVRYKDEATAFNGQKKEVFEGKGEWNNRISALLFTLLQERGIPNHFVRLLSPTEQLVQEVSILPLEVVVRNKAAGSMAKRLGLPEGQKLQRPIVEFYYKNDELGDPLVTREHAEVLGWATPEELDEMIRLALEVNRVLSAFFLERDVILVDFKLEFGRDAEGRLLLADEISPDTCRFWDARTMERLDKDRFRRDMGGLGEAYQEILRRIGGQHE